MKHYLTLVVLFALMLPLSEGCRRQPPAEPKPEMSQNGAAAVNLKDDPQEEERSDELCSYEPTILQIRAHMDSTALLELLGKPDSVSSQPDFRDEEANLIAWHYPGLWILLGSYNSVGGVTIDGQGPKTSKGIGVGDSVSLVRQLYGLPSSEYRGELCYQNDHDSEHMNMLSFTIKDSIVVRIYAGHLYD